MMWLPHSTVATVVEERGKFLLVEETDGGGRVFNQPAGHLDENETLFDAAVRETLEETGWHVQLTDFLGTYVYKNANGITYIRHCFIGAALHHDPALPLDTGVIAAHWLSADDIRSPDFPARSPMVLQAVEDFLSGIRFPLASIHHYPAQNET